MSSKGLFSYLAYLLKYMLVTLVLTHSVFAFSQDVSEVKSIQLEKAYQQILYEYYQGNYALALTHIAVLQQKFPQGLQQIPGHLAGQIVEPELLKGGISLAYGLNDQAADIFARLLNTNASDDVKAFAWLLLGKTYYQNREFSAAAQAFSQISTETAEDFFDDHTRDNWLYLQSQLHGFLLTDEASNAADQNIQWLEQLSGRSVYRHYVDYNQALALLQNGNTEQAIFRLNELANNRDSVVRRWVDWVSPLFSDTGETSEPAEQNAIRDRANLTLAYTLLQQGEPHEAYRVFEKIRTYGLDGEAALLGYGWAAAKKDDLQIALAIWQRLMHMPQNSEYTLEAYLASAYAYEKAFAPRQSLQVLEQGILRFERAIVTLDSALERVNQRAFILELLPSFNDRAADTAISLPSLNDEAQQLNTKHIFKSIAVTNEFRTGLEALNQSHEIEQQLNKWRLRMQQYHLMLDERQEERTKRAKQILQNRTLAQLEELKERRNLLRETVETAEQQQNGQIFMPEQNQKWLARVKRSEQRLANIAALKTTLNQSPLAAKYQERLRRVAGRLSWQASEALPANLWQAKKALMLVDQDITKAQKRQQALLKQLAAKPDFTEQRQRVSLIAERVDIQLEKNTQLQNALISDLASTFSEFIKNHRAKINNYILQAQLAVVRLSDQALQKDDSELREKRKLDKATVAKPEDGAL